MEEEYELIPMEEILERIRDDWSWELMAEVRILLKELTSADAVVCYCSRVILSDFPLLQQGTQGLLLRKSAGIATNPNKRITFEDEEKCEERGEKPAEEENDMTKGGFDPQEGVFKLKLEPNHLKRYKTGSNKKKCKSKVYFRLVAAHLINCSVVVHSSCLVKGDLDFPASIACLHNVAL